MKAFDTSTIDMAKVNRLPVFKCPPTYNLQKDPGNGCAGDAPGYPTYFTQSVYTQYGNNPARGAQTVIFGHVIDSAEDWEGCADWDAYRAKINKRLHSLYVPLPFEHPRVQAWIASRCSHLNHCYIDPSKPERDNDRTIIYPVPNYKREHFRNDTRFSDAWRETELTRVANANAEIERYYSERATIDNHLAVRSVREIYPDWTPTAEELETRAHAPHPGNWWERYAENFTPETCPGQYNSKHPVNGSWCQMCGWHAE